ncbi:MAG TPA: hypothetical protein VMM36_11990 [Opitutaceae bacterium]|nr:hypothetical protein [Opitutaceae bacterium]
MNRTHFDQLVPTDNYADSTPAVRDLVHARTEELAVMAGRSPQDVSLDDYAQAKRELTGQSDRMLQDAVLGLPVAYSATRHESQPEPKPNSGVAA